MIRGKSHSIEFPPFLLLPCMGFMGFQIQETQYESIQGQKIWKVTDVITILK